MAEIAILLMQHKAILGAVVILLLSSIEILPIKLNPWSWLLSLIRKLNGTDILEKKIDILSNNMSKLENRVDEGQAIQSRVRILRFGDELRLNQKHSEDSFNQVLDDITRYNKYCDTHPDFPNEKTVSTAKIIKRSYEDALRSNTFL